MTYAVNVASLGSNGGTSISTWTTGTRPSSPRTGQMGFNTTLGSLEVYNGTSWATAGGLNTQSVQTTGFTAVAGNIYPCNTTSAAFTVTLPASPTAGNQIQIIDYAGTFATNGITLGRNGSNILGDPINCILNVNRESVILTYIDNTQGWVVSSAAYTTSPLLQLAYNIDYLVVAGAGGGGGNRGGGGGAGGYIASNLTVDVGNSYSLVVGAGGVGMTSGNNSAQGSNSTGFSQTAIGGGRGGGNRFGQVQPGGSGGSGGGAGSNGGYSGGSGTSGQGFAGGTTVTETGAGGGGASAVGTNSNNSQAAGGAGTAWLNGSTYAVGGTGFPGPDNSGGGGNGTANTGNGAQGGSGNVNGGTGGSGVVIVRYLGSQRGTGGTVTSSGGYTYHTFTSSGTFTV